MNHNNNILPLNECLICLGGYAEIRSKFRNNQVREVALFLFFQSPLEGSWSRSGEQAGSRCPHSFRTHHAQLLPSTVARS